MSSALQERFHDPRSMRPASGAAVVSRDGLVLGEVARVEGVHFRVAPGTGHGFWLTNDQILSCNGTSVALALTAAELDDYRLSRPGGEAWEPPVLDALQDTLLTESERLRQRQRMEQELRNQTERWPRA